MLRGVAMSMLVAAAAAAPEADLVAQPLPGFPVGPFKVYSGYLEVNEKVAGYDKLMIHYQLDMSQGNPTKDPVVAWHTGGPGGSSIYGLYGEMGYFQVSQGGQYTNEYAWNRLANMLYLESPAGSFLTPSDLKSGFSWCERGGVVQPQCHWNDTSQAEAYGHTLNAFFKKFPELAGNDFYLAGESYAGQYVPNIANRILTAPETQSINLKGIAVGNGCWGGTATSVNCNGPNTQRNDVEFYYGHGTISKSLYEAINEACHFDSYKPSVQCEREILKMDQAVGPHNVYDLYDNCPSASFNEAKGNLSFRQYKNMLRSFDPDQVAAAHEGGYKWSCGQFDAIPTYFARKDVQTALHLGKQSPSTFGYTQSGPASVTLYPFLASKIRVLIYNGDVDTCVPYNGNEEWTTGLAEKGVLKETSPWHPWSSQAGDAVPAGYATSYNTTASHDFTFVTIRLGGHEVPNFRPRPGFYMIKRFLEHKPF